MPENIKYNTKQSLPQWSTITILFIVSKRKISQRYSPFCSSSRKRGFFAQTHPIYLVILILSTPYGRLESETTHVIMFVSPRRQWYAVSIITSRIPVVVVRKILLTVELLLIYLVICLPPDCAWWLYWFVRKIETEFHTWKIKTVTAKQTILSLYKHWP